MGVFADYDCGGFFDEAHHGHGGLRPHYRTLVDQMGAFPPGELARREQLRDQAFRTAGITRVQRAVGGDHPVIRTALVTARNAPATKRVVNTLRTWDVRVDESFFLGGIEKAGVLEALRPHIFFDDQLVHLGPSRESTPSAHVLGRELAD